MQKFGTGMSEQELSEARAQDKGDRAKLKLLGRRETHAEAPAVQLSGARMPPPAPWELADLRASRTPPTVMLDEPLTVRKFRERLVPRPVFREPRIVVHFYGGRRRSGDFQAAAEDWLSAMGLEFTVLALTVDVI